MTQPSKQTKTSKQAPKQSKPVRSAPSIIAAAVAIGALSVLVQARGSPTPVALASTIRHGVAEPEELQHEALQADSVNESTLEGVAEESTQVVAETRDAVGSILEDVLDVVDLEDAMKAAQDMLPTLRHANAPPIPVQHRGVTVPDEDNAAQDG